MSRPVATLLTFILAGTAAAAEGRKMVDLTFADLRFAPCVTNKGYGSTLGITFGDIGGYNRGFDDFGYVLGFRGYSAGKVEATIDNDVDQRQEMYALGFQITGGFAFCPARGQHVEIVGGYGTGMDSISGKVVDVGNDGRYDQWLAEIGWYLTFANRMQVGVPVGYSWTQYRFDGTDHAEHLGRANGFSLGLSVGYRL